MSNYTTEQFINNYIKDRNVFGEETQYIYNDILGMLNEDFTSMKLPLKYLDELVGKIGEKSGETLNTLQKGLKAAGEEGLNSLNNVSNGLKAASEKGLDSLNNILNGLKAPSENGFVTKMISPEESVANKMRDVIKNSNNQSIPAEAEAELNNNVLSNIFSSVKDKGILNSITSWFSGIENKIKNVFGGLASGNLTFSQLIGKGLAWVTNPVNMPRVLKTSGGIVLLALIIKSLKKRHALNKYKNLQELANIQKREISNKNSLKEEFLLSEHEVALRDVLNECETNKRLHSIMYEAETVKSNYFKY